LEYLSIKCRFRLEVSHSIGHISTYVCYDTSEKRLHDFFVEGMTLRDRRRDGNMGADGIGLPNGSAGGIGLPNGTLRWVGVSRRLVPAIDKMGFRSASVVREE
jgi:hypothetical protein